MEAELLDKPDGRPVEAVAGHSAPWRGRSGKEFIPFFHLLTLSEHTARSFTSTGSFQSHRSPRRKERFSYCVRQGPRREEISSLKLRNRGMSNKGIL